MLLHIFQLPSDSVWLTTSPVHTVMAAAVAYAAYRLCTLRKSTCNEPPLVPYTWPIIGHMMEYYGAPDKFVKECYEKYGSTFSIYVLGQTHTFIGPELASEVMRAPDTKLSGHVVNRKLMSFDFFFGTVEDYLGPITAAIRGQFTQNIPVLLGRIMEECESAFTEKLGSTMVVDNVGEIVSHCVARTASAVLVADKKVSRHPDVHRIALSIVKDVEMGANFSFVPIKWLRNWLLMRTTSADQTLRVMEAHILPEVIRRRAEAQRNPNYNPPVDLLQVISDVFDADDETPSPQALGRRVTYCLLLFTEIAENVTHLLYDIAGYAHVRTRLYEEQQQIVTKHGNKITAEALRDMIYLEACLRESLRLNTIPLALFRQAVQNVTFANGITIPAGRVCLFNMHAMNHNASVYKDAQAYLPDRSMDQPNLRATTTSPSYVTFGLGRSSCPGRFLAVAEMMAFAAWLLRRYDFSTKSGQRPPNRLDSAYQPTKEPIVFVKRDV